MVDVETGEAPRAMRPLAVDPPARPAQRRAEPIPSSEPRKRPITHRSQKAKPPGKPPVQPPRIEPDSSGNGHAEPGLSVDETVGENPFIARPSTAPFGIDEVLWGEDWQADASTSAAAGNGDAKSRPWRRGLRG